MARNNPLVSVIIITYDDAKYLETTLESVKAQDYENIEIIVSDDGSKDDTVVIAKKWLDANKNHFSNTQLLSVDNNTGVTGNYQRAEKAAKGVWLKTIGGDDILYPSCISENVLFVNSHPNVDVVVSRQELINDAGVKLPTPDKTKEYYYFYQSSNMLQKEYILRFDPIEDTCLFKSKRMMEAINYYDLDYTMQEDSPLKMRIAMGGFKYWSINKFLLAKRLRVGSLSGLSDSRIIVNNDIVRIAINKKYYIPYLKGLEKSLMKYDAIVVSLFFKNQWLNRKNVFCKTIFRFLRLPVVVTRKSKIRKINRSFLNDKNGKD
jgi:alpha-1,3-rhamnosyltransferase